jgi:hypothetical protein
MHDAGDTGRTYADTPPTHPAAASWPAAQTAPTAATTKIDWALADIEPVLYDLRANIGILGHLAMAEAEVTQDQWQYVEGNLIGIHSRLEALWSAAWQQQKAEQQAHEEALAEAQTRTEAPGSAADVERAKALWHLLRGAATVTLRQCDEVMP